MNSIEIGLTFLQRHPADVRRRQSGGWMARLYCTPRMFKAFDAILGRKAWRRLWICLCQGLNLGDSEKEYSCSQCHWHDAESGGFGVLHVVGIYVMMGGTVCNVELTLKN